jgi:hypothetical protein
MVTAGWLSACRREDLLLLRRDGGVALDERGQHATHRLDSERERDDVEKEDVLHIAGIRHTALNCSARGNHFIWVHPLVGLAA